MVSFVGIFGNCNIVIASLRIRKLRVLWNIMIAIRAFCDVIHQIGNFVTAYVYFTNSTLSQFMCFFIQVIPTCGLLYGTFLHFTISVDRLIAVTKPFIYSKIKIYVFIFLITLLSLGFIFPMIFVVHRETNFSEKPLICTAPIFHHKIFDDGIFFILFTVLNFSTVTIYCIIWIIIRNKVGLITKHSQILKPITIIVFFLIIGYGFNIISNIIVDALELKPENFTWVSDLLFYILGLTINITLSTEYFIYFVFNKEYRKAFVEQLGLKKALKIVSIAK
uniref:G-protein coupled receptors family 1 profile domain-containing protein n=1 Tax=Panagrolaimus sp. PS1159 TaxID=55785 RepID=A0AC35FAK1_9BILA